MSNENVSLAPAASPDKNKKMLHGLLKMPADNGANLLI